MSDEEPFEELKRVSKAYSEFLAVQSRNLPQSAIELSKLAGMEDGLFVLVLRKNCNRDLRIIMRCGHLQMGYYDLVLDYENVEMSSEHNRTLAHMARASVSDQVNGCDFVYEEFECIKNGRFEHRMIFMSWQELTLEEYPWIAVRFDKLHWRRIPKGSRKLPHCANRYPGGPDENVASSYLR